LHFVAASAILNDKIRQLGGKSPVVVDPKCNLKGAARKIWWGKMNNAGQVLSDYQMTIRRLTLFQTCVAPDYVLVPKHFQNELVAALKEVYVRSRRARGLY
jgi:aldehyde dehydrogenase (NAD+)